jgi:thiol-disulfide isomerase/thioredoxin
MSPKPQARSNTTTLFIIAGVVAVIAVVAVVVAIFAGGEDEPSADPSIVAECPTEADAAPQPVDPEPFVDGEIFQPVGISGAALTEYTGDVDDPAACELVPVLSGYDYEGNSTVIDPATDGPTLVVFLAHWCPHCNREVPVLNDWRDSGNVPDELSVVGVSTAAAADRDNYPPDEWLATMDWTWPVLADGDISTDDGTDGVYTTAFRSYGTTGFPTMAFVDSSGRLRWRVSGEMSAETLQQLVDEALAADTAAA